MPSTSFPIWKDYVVTLGGGDAYEYRIMTGGVVVYQGKAYRRPNETNVTIRINDICADYLRNVLPVLSQAEFSAITLPVEFTVQAFISTAPDEPPAWEDMDDVAFINDWSYDDTHDAAVDGLSRPINGVVDARQWLIHTAYLASQETVTLTFADGSRQTVIVPIERTNDFNDDFNFDFSRSTASAGSGSIAVDLSAWVGLKSVDINGTTYRVADSCHRYALHYLNAFGGWDSLLIEGNSRLSETIDRATMKVEYDNRSTANRGARNYANEIRRTITMSTGWLTDEQSLMMHHVLNSVDVYVEDIEKRRFYPVVLTDNAVEYKTFRTNDGRLVNYQINAELAADRMRR